LARLRALVGAILAAALVLAFAAPASANGGTAEVRAFHNSPDTPAVDVQAKLFGRWVPVVRGLEFGEASGYLLLPAWTYRLRIVAAGTNTVVKDLGKVRLKGSTSYTAWAVGFLSPDDSYPGFDVFVSVDG